LFVRSVHPRVHGKEKAEVQQVGKHLPASAFPEHSSDRWPAIIAV